MVERCLLGDEVGDRVGVTKVRTPTPRIGPEGASCPGAQTSGYRGRMAARWCLFDLNGTLVDPAVAAGPLGGSDDDRRLVAAAFQEALFYAMADTLSGEYRPFVEHLRSAIERRLLLERGDADPLEAMLYALRRMPAMPGARDALERLASAGLRLAVVSNSTRDAALEVLEASGLGDAFELVRGSDEVRAYKPSATVYLGAVEATGADAADCVMVAAHAWDLMGAKRRGLSTAWVSAHEGRWPGTAPAPDVEGDTLLAVAAAITALREWLDEVGGGELVERPSAAADLVRDARDERDAVLADRVDRARRGRGSG